MDDLIILTAMGFATALLMSLIAGLMGFFRVPLKAFEAEPVMPFSATIWAFGIFIVIKYILSPAFLVVGNYLLTGETFKIEQFEQSPELQGWYSLILMVLLIFAYLFFFFVLKPEIRSVACGKSRSVINDISLGIVTWFIAYPWVFTFNHMVDYFTLQFYTGPQIEQIIVQHLRQMYEYPLLFWLTAASVMLVVPIIEELLFRGLLQQWLKQKTGTFAGIVLTALCFSLMHYSYNQGIFNISILSSLFVLGLFLGFLRERQNSILAPIALHSTVNIISFFIILVQEKFNEVFMVFSTSFSYMHFMCRG